MRRTVPPSAEIEQRIDGLLASGLAVEDPQGALSELASLGARLIIQRAVEEEFDAAHVELQPAIAAADALAGLHLV